MADLESRVPVSPENTTFRVASVSKLVTATAVMKLVELGRIDLDQDVNTYLATFQVPDRFSQPITARHLLTHSAGFSARFLDSRSRTRTGQAALGTYLGRRLPARFIAPGKIISYANHNMALAGFLVESVAGLPFEGYVPNRRFTCQRPTAGRVETSLRATSTFPAAVWTRWPI